MSTNLRTKVTRNVCPGCLFYPEISYSFIPAPDKASQANYSAGFVYILRISFSHLLLREGLFASTPACEGARLGGRPARRAPDSEAPQPIPPSVCARRRGRRWLSSFAIKDDKTSARGFIYPSLRALVTRCQIFQPCKLSLTSTKCI